MTSADRSNLGHLRMILHAVKPHSLTINHTFMMCNNLLHAFILGLDSVNCYRVGIDWNRLGQLYYIKLTML